MERRRRFYLPITRTLVLLVIMLILMAYASWMLVGHVKSLFWAHSEMQNRALLSLAANVTNEHINTILTRLQGLAYLSSDMLSRNSGSASAEWNRRMRMEAQRLGFQNIAVTDLEGNTISTNGKRFRIPNIAENDLFRMSASGFSIVSGIVRDKITDDTLDNGHDSIIFQVPIFKGALVAGAMSASMPLENAFHLLSGINISYDGDSMFIMDSDNRIITSSLLLSDPHKDLLLGSDFFGCISDIATPQERLAIFNDLEDLPSKNAYSYTTKGDRNYISFAALTGGSGWKLAAVSSENGIMHSQKKMIYKTGLLFIAVIASIIVSLICLYIMSYKYRKERNLNRAAFDRSGLHLFMLAPDGTVKWFDDNFADLLGIPRKERSFNFVELMEDNQTVFPQDSIKGGDSFRLPLRTRDAKMLYLMVHVIGDDEGGFHQSFAADVTQDEMTREHIRILAYTDATTRLPNRESFSLKIEELGRRCLREELQTVCLFIDINDAHKILEIFGDRVNRNMLLEAAERLSDVAKRHGCLLYSLGNDDFAMLIEDIGKSGSWESICSSVEESFAAPFVFSHSSFDISCRIGVVPCVQYQNHTPIHPSDMFRYGEMTVRLAKNPSNIFILDTHTYEAVIKDLDMEHDFSKSMKNGELELYYQPIYDSISDTIFSLEALLRWHSAEHGEVPPHKFIPFAEKSGLINQVGDFVIEKALAFAASLIKEKGVSVQVNVSAIQLMQPDFAEKIIRQTRRYGIPPHSFGIEITEACLMENTHGIREKLEKMKSEGIMIFIDDFGTGYSSLSYLKDMPADYIKIDRSFVAGIETSDRQKNIMKAITSISSAIGTQVIAEGVETNEELAVVLQSGCRFVQGFLFATPMPADEAVDFINWFNS